MERVTIISTKINIYPTNYLKLYQIKSIHSANILDIAKNSPPE